MFKNIKHIHFIGIGGIGMSGIAEVLHSLGYKISGSDIRESQIVRHLKDLGILIYIGHNKNNVNDADIIVYSSAVKRDNIEIIQAIENKIPVIPRAEMLAELMRMKYSVGIAGTHGKTTTTSMIGCIFQHANLDPTIIVGGQVRSMNNTNAKLGKGKFLIAEADESDKSFLKLLPTIAVITNIDMDHMDNYKNLDDIIDNFNKFASSVPFNGSIIVCNDDKNVKKAIKGIDRKIITYGFNIKSEIHAINPKYNVMGSQYTLEINNMPLAEIELKVPGKHNILNSLAAVGVAVESGIDIDTIKEGLALFDGVKRRFEIIYKNNKKNIYIIDDYAHHPKEIFTVLDSAKKLGDYKIITIFQPHLYSRTYNMLDDFAKILSKSDITVLTDIYPAREQPMKGVNGELLFNETKKFKQEDIYYIENKNEIPDFLKNFIKDNTVFLFIGAGDIVNISKNFINSVKNYEKN